MILLDWSNVMIGNIMISQKYIKDLDEGLIRHLVLNNIRNYRKKFSKKYGELVICTDTHSSWRKGAFPEYKASRKAAREESTTDWVSLFEIINMITDEIRWSPESGKIMTPLDQLSEELKGGESEEQKVERKAAEETQKKKKKDRKKTDEKIKKADSPLGIIDAEILEEFSNAS